MINKDLIPGTVEYRGFTITFSIIYGEGTPKIRCQIREDDSFFVERPVDHEIEEVDLTKLVNILTDLAETKIDALYTLLNSTLGKFEKMVSKQVRRNMIDERCASTINVAKTQIDILNKFFTQ